MSVKVCHITSVHDPLDVRIFYKECVSLAKAGYDVTLLHAKELNTVKENVTITGINYQYRSRYDRFKNVTDALLLKAIDLKAAVYHIHDPELLRIVPGLKKTGAKVIYDAHEDLPRDVLSKHWIPSIFRKPFSLVVEVIENRYARKADAIVTSTPFIAQRFLKIKPLTVDVNNYPLLGETLALKQSEKKNEVCYIGSITRERGIVEIIGALAYADVTLHLAGTFEDEQLKTELQKKDEWKKVKYHGHVGRDEVWDILSKSKAGLVTLYPKINYLDSLPIKMFEYMAAEIPVIASDFPYWKKIVEENKCGITVNPKDPEAIGKAINEMISKPEMAIEMGKNGRKAILEKLNWNVEEKKLVSLYNGLVNGLLKVGS